MVVLELKIKQIEHKDIRAVNFCINGEIEETQFFDQHNSAILVIQPALSQTGLLKLCVLYRILNSNPEN